MKILFISMLSIFFSLPAMSAHHEGHSHENLDKAEKVSVVPGESKIVWTGAKKFTDSSHTGTIQLKSGQIFFKDGLPTHGDFVVNMSSIENTDVSDPKYKEKLENHLKSEDFFAVSDYEEAKFTFDKVKSLGEDQYALTGRMEIRGVENQETIQATIKKNEEGYIAKADIVLDRSKYGVSYNTEGSTKEEDSDEWFFVKWFKGGVKVAKDKIIKNDMNLSVELVAKSKE